MTSFEELVRRFQMPLVHFLRRRISAAEADDVAQDTFLRAYENLDRYRPTARFSTWLFTIGCRLCSNARRKQKNVGRYDALDDVQSSEQAPPQIAANREHQAKLWKVAAEMLSEPEYRAVWLHYVEGMSTGEISRVMGRTRAAIKTMLFRSRRKLIPVLEELDPLDRPSGRLTRTDPSSRPTGAEANHE
jgi:RNA polymerase sigma-70 factor (ECF subfamily)